MLNIWKEEWEECNLWRASEKFKMMEVKKNQEIAIRFTKLFKRHAFICPSGAAECTYAELGTSGIF